MLPIFSVITATIIVALNGPLVKLLGLSPFINAALRLFIPTLILGIYLKYKKIPFFPKKTKTLLSLSTFNAIRLPLIFAAFALTSITNAIICVYTWPLFASLFGHIYLHEKITSRDFINYSIAFSGVVISQLNSSLTFSSTDFLGTILAILSAIIFSFSIVLLKQVSSEYSKTEMIFYQNFVGGIIFLPAFFIFPVTNLIHFSLGSLQYGIMAGLLAFYLFFIGLKKLSVTNYSILTYFEIIAAATFGILFFDEELSWNIVVGSVLIIYAGLSVTLNNSQKCKKQSNN